MGNKKLKGEFLADEILSKKRGRKDRKVDEMPTIKISEAGAD